MTAPTPDVRVIVRGAVALDPLKGKLTPLSIGVQNHSPVSVFLGNVYIETTTGEQIFFKDDLVTGEWQKRRELRPGEAFEFHIDPAELMKFSGKGLVCAAVRDAIDRIYRSSESELRNALRSVDHDLTRGEARRVHLMRPKRIHRAGRGKVRRSCVRFASSARRSGSGSSPR
jgi:hypothetical protein